MFNQQNKFKFIAQIMGSSNDECSNSEIHKYLPNIYETNIMSKTFNDYKKCLDTCNEFLKDIVDEINSRSKFKYIIIWNENPKYSNNKKKEPDIELEPWEEDEVIKFYVTKLKNIKNQKIAASIKTTIYLEEVGFTDNIGSRLTH